MHYATGLGILEITFSIFPLRRHFVHTRIRFGPDSVWTRTRWRFGNQRRFVCWSEPLIRWPDIGRLLQIVQTRDILIPPFSSVKCWSNLNINDTTITAEMQISLHSTQTPPLRDGSRLPAIWNHQISILWQYHFWFLPQGILLTADPWWLRK